MHHVPIPVLTHKQPRRAAHRRKASILRFFKLLWRTVHLPQVIADIVVRGTKSAPYLQPCRVLWRRVIPHMRTCGVHGCHPAVEKSSESGSLSRATDSTDSRLTERHDHRQHRTTDSYTDRTRTPPPRPSRSVCGSGQKASLEDLFVKDFLISGDP